MHLIYKMVMMPNYIYKADALEPLKPYYKESKLNHK